MFTPYDDLALFYDRKPRNRDLEYEFGYNISATEYEELFSRVDYRRLAEIAAGGNRFDAVRSRVGAWLAKLDCRLRSRLLRQPCAQPVSIR